MATRKELQELALLRLREAEALFAAGFYDGCVYLCGYVVELALKAAICATLAIPEYPDGPMFWTHKFEQLTLLAGLQEQIKITPKTNRVLPNNWSVATDWRPEWRYQPEGTYGQARAESALEAIKADPDGVLAYLSRRW
jgi:HEPN domain-containing protein